MDAALHPLAFLSLSVQGAVMAVVIRAATTANLTQSLIVAVTSALISGVFILVSAHITRQEIQVKLEKPIQDVAAKVAADRRSDDSVRDAARRENN